MAPRRRPATIGHCLQSAVIGDDWPSPQVEELEGLTAQRNSPRDGECTFNGPSEGMPIQAEVDVQDLLEVNDELQQFTVIFLVTFKCIIPAFKEDNDKFREFIENQRQHPFVKLSSHNQVSMLEQIGPHVVQLLKITQDTGAHVQWSTRYKCCFQDEMNFRAFPFDRQLLCMRLFADTGMSRFKLVPVESAGGHAKMKQLSRWKVCEEIQKISTMYVERRRSDQICAQALRTEPIRTNFNVLIHIERKADASLRGIYGILLLSTIVAILGFYLHLGNIRSRLSLLFFIAVSISAYWYGHVLLGKFPHSGRMTMLDRYVCLTLCFFSLLLAESFLVAAYTTKDIFDFDIDTYVARHDRGFAVVAFGSWILGHACAMLKVFIGRSCRSGKSKGSEEDFASAERRQALWSRVYQEKGNVISSWDKEQEYADHGGPRTENPLTQDEFVAHTLANWEDIKDEFLKVVNCQAPPPPPPPDSAFRALREPLLAHVPELTELKTLLQHLHRQSQLYADHKAKAENAGQQPHQRKNTDGPITFNRMAQRASSADRPRVTRQNLVPPSSGFSDQAESRWTCMSCGHDNVAGSTTCDICGKRQEAPRVLFDVSHVEPNKVQKVLEDQPPTEVDENIQSAASSLWKEVQAQLEKECGYSQSVLREATRKAEATIKKENAKGNDQADELLENTEGRDQPTPDEEKADPDRKRLIDAHNKSQPDDSTRSGHSLRSVETPDFFERSVDARRPQPDDTTRSLHSLRSAATVIPPDPFGTNAFGFGR